MNTLEKMVRDIYVKHNYLYYYNDLKNAAEYIEEINSSGMAESDTYTPEDWFNDAMYDDPGQFTTKNNLCCRIADYFLRQRRKCIEQTGCIPNYEDFVESMDCDEYKLYVGKYLNMIGMAEFINFLLDYYEKEGNIDE